MNGLAKKLPGQSLFKQSLVRDILTVMQAGTGAPIGSARIHSMIEALKEVMEYARTKQRKG